MALEPIGDIANPALTENVGAEALTWETASDWDNAADELGVAHENTADTGYDDASTIIKGFGTGSNFYKSADLRVLYLFQETSGSTIHDLSGNIRDGTYGGISGDPTLGDTGLLGQPAPASDANDISQSAAIGNPSSGTWAVWVIEDSVDNDTNNPHWTREGEDFLIKQNDDQTWTRMSGTDYKAGSMPTGNWHLHLSTSDGSNAAQYHNGSQLQTFNDSWGDISGAGIMGRDSGGEEVVGRISLWVYWDTMFTSTEVSEFYDIVEGVSYLETATKSYSSPRTPDLQNLQYSLNGQSIDLKVIGSPGTASEEIVTQTLDGSTSYSLTWSNSHTDFRIRPELSTSDPTVAPTFGRGEIFG